MQVAMWPHAQDIPARDITTVRPHPVRITPGTATTATITIAQRIIILGPHPGLQA